MIIICLPCGGVDRNRNGSDGIATNNSVIPFVQGLLNALTKLIIGDRGQNRWSKK